MKDLKLKIREKKIVGNSCRDLDTIKIKVEGLDDQICYQRGTLIARIKTVAVGKVVSCSASSLELDPTGFEHNQQLLKIKNLSFVEIIVTRHPGLVEYLKEEGLISEGVEVLTHASPDAVQGKHVLGVLPHSLSCLTRSFTEIPLSLPPELRGKELTADDVRQHAGAPVTYQVRKL